MKQQIGDRVGALASIKDGVACLIGYGVYDGDHLPPGLKPFAEVWAEIKQEVTAKNPAMTEEKARELFENNPLFKNPRITLDDGTVVWGKECWWGPEDQIKEKIAGLTVVQVRVVRDDLGRAKAFEKVDA